MNAVQTDQERRQQSAWLALTLWNLSYLYGNIEGARKAVEVMHSAGWPTSGMFELVEEHWRDVPAAHTGWACPIPGQAEPAEKHRSVASAAEVLA